MRRRWKIALWVVGVAVVAPAVLLSPPVTELSINLTCRMKPLTQTCSGRMNALALIWTKVGWLDRAIEWYGRAAAEGNDPASDFHLGWAYEQRGYRDLFAKQQAHEKKRDEDADKLVAELKPKLDAGLISEADYVGALEKAYSAQPNLREDFERAEAAYRKAANRGFAPAINNLGQMYVSGVFGRERRQEGVALILRAAEAGNPLGAVNATLIYTAGMGVARDSDKASRWGQWNGEGTNSRDLSYPVLEHSRMALSGDSGDPTFAAMIREAAKRRLPLEASFKPMRQDPRLPTFSSVKERLEKRAN